MEIAGRLKALRQKKGLSQYRLAQESGISQSFLSALEAGSKWPTVYTLDKICRCLDLSLAEFFSEDPEQVPDHVRPLLEEVRRLKPEQCRILADFLSSIRYGGNGKK